MKTKLLLNDLIGKCFIQEESLNIKYSHLYQNILAFKIVDIYENGNADCIALIDNKNEYMCSNGIIRVELPLGEPYGDMHIIDFFKEWDEELFTEKIDEISDKIFS